MINTEHLDKYEFVREMKITGSRRLARQDMETLDYHVFELLKSNCLGKENRIKAYDLIELLKKWHIQYVGIKMTDLTIRRSIERIRKNNNSYKIVESIEGRNGGYYIRILSDKRNNGQLHRVKAGIRTLIATSDSKEVVENINAIYKELSVLTSKLDKPAQNQIRMIFNAEKGEINYYGDK